MRPTNHFAHDYNAHYQDSEDAYQNISRVEIHTLARRASPQRFAAYRATAVPASQEVPENGHFSVEALYMGSDGISRGEGGWRVTGKK